MEVVEQTAALYVLGMQLVLNEEASDGHITWAFTPGRLSDIWGVFGAQLYRFWAV